MLAQAPPAAQDPRSPVREAYASFRSKQDEESLGKLRELVQQGGHGSAACLALTKVRPPAFCAACCRWRRWRIALY